MNTHEIAQKLLHRRNAMNPIILPGEMLSTLGADAMQEALQRRWIVANPDTGMLQIAPDMSKVEEMQESSKEAPPETSTPEPQCESHAFSVRHAARHPNFLHELLSPATGHDPSQMQPPQATSAPTTPVAATAGSPAHKPGVGDSVLIAQEGRTYTGTVGAVQGGRYRVTFGGADRPKQERDYAENEIKLVQPLATAR